MRNDTLAPSAIVVAASSERGRLESPRSLEMHGGKKKKKKET